MPDYSDWRAAEQDKTERAKIEHGARHAARARALQALGRQMADLVGSDDWASYRLAIEAARDGEQAALASLRDRILAPDCVGDALMKLKLEAQRVAGRIEGLEVALRVPTTYQALAEATPAAS